MPFPLAHPAAVVPLRRFCPRWLNLAALVIGSLTPDVGYCFGQLHLAAFSHRLLAGSFGFCLPVGFVLLLLFQRLRRRVVGCLPSCHRRALEPLCGNPAFVSVGTVASLLIGAWTHVILDLISHEDRTLAGLLPFFAQSSIPGDSHDWLDDSLCAGFTFIGVFCVTLTYLNWLERTVNNRGWMFPGFKRVVVIAFSSLSLLLSFASHDRFFSLGVGSLGMLSTLLVMAFLLITDWGLISVSWNPEADRVAEDVRLEQT